MVLSLRTNTAALGVEQYVKQSSKSSVISISKLSSGSKSPSIRDDSSLVIIGSRVNNKIIGLKQALSSTSNATSLLQVVDGAYKNIGDILNKQSILVSKAQSGSVSDTQRSLYTAEFQDLTSQINTITKDTSFRGKNLFDENITLTSLKSQKGVEIVESDRLGVLSLKFNKRNSVFVLKDDGAKVGSYRAVNDIKKGEDFSFEIKGVKTEINAVEFNSKKSFNFAYFKTKAENSGGKDYSFLVGNSENESNKLKVFVGLATSKKLGLDDVSLRTQEGASDASAILENAKIILEGSKAKVSSVLSRLDFTSSSLSVAIENRHAARSDLLDVDIASETEKFAKNQVSLQSGVFLLAQANQRSAHLLELIKN